MFVCLFIKVRVSDFGDTLAVYGADIVQLVLSFLYSKFCCDFNDDLENLYSKVTFLNRL